MPERVLLFWSKVVKHLIDEDTWKSDRVIEVPDQIDASSIDKVAQRLTAVLQEEIGIARQSELPLRIVQLGPPAFQGVFDHVLSNVLTPVGGELTIIKARRKESNSPVVILDTDATNKVLARFGFVDFTKPPLTYKRLYNDSHPASLDPPEGFQKGKVL
jgi:tetrahydromethanopterin S-methyltransferase subunit A